MHRFLLRELLVLQPGTLSQKDRHRKLKSSPFPSSKRPAKSIHWRKYEVCCVVVSVKCGSLLLRRCRWDRLETCTSPLLLGYRTRVESWCLAFAELGGLLGD
jgi:hypothetical protein